MTTFTKLSLKASAPIATISDEDDEDVDTSELESANLLHEDDIHDEENVDDMIYEDLFIVESKNFDTSLIKSINLPKFIMGQGSLSFKEKGFVLINFWGDHKKGAYKAILKSMGDNMGKFRIKFLDPETKEVISVWEFLNPRVHAVDFGHAARARETPAEFAVEIDYTGLKIDDVSI